MAPKGKNKKSKQSMVDKTKVKVEHKDEVLGRKVVGMGFALVGFLLIVGVIVLNVLSNVEPRLDDELNVPKLNELEEFTNEDKVVLTGEVEDVDQVIIYVNDKMQTTVADVQDGEFEYEYVFSDEGKHAFQAVSVEGFPVRKGSEKSNSVDIMVDWTAPSADIKLEYSSEVADGLLTVSGEAEADITVSLFDEDEEVASVETDDEGKFEIENIELVAGTNEFRVELEDRAGNRNVLARRIEVESPVDAPEEILGQADIPEASGDFSKIFGMVLNRNLMMVFGVLALMALIGSSSVVLYKARQDSTN